MDPESGAARLDRGARLAGATVGLETGRVLQPSQLVPGLLGQLVFDGEQVVDRPGRLQHPDGPSGGGLTCDDGPGGSNATRAAQRLRPVNIASGVAFWVVYAYGVYDGIRGYRRISREQAVQPYVTASHENQEFAVSLGIVGRF